MKTEKTLITMFYVYNFFQSITGTVKTRHVSKFIYGKTRNDNVEMGRRPKRQTTAVVNSTQVTITN